MSIEQCPFHLFHDLQFNRRNRATKTLNDIANILHALHITFGDQPVLCMQLTEQRVGYTCLNPALMHR